MYKVFSIFIFLAKALENILQFVAVIFVAYLALFLFYMLFALGNSQAMDSLRILVDPIIFIADMFFSNDKPEFGQLQQFVVGITLLSGGFLVSQFLKNRCTDLVKFLEISKENCRRFEDKQVNLSIHRSAKNMNKKISKCMVYLELKKKEHLVETVDLKEQYELLNKYLSSKVGVVPENFLDGFLYKFPDIEKIDSDIVYFFYAIKSKAPVDYMMILQVIEKSLLVAQDEIQKLRSAGLYNSIIMSPTTSLRYEYNDARAYTNGIIGHYLCGNEEMSIYELKEKFFEY